MVFMLNICRSDGTSLSVNLSRQERKIIFILYEHRFFYRCSLSMYNKTANLLCFRADPSSNNGDRNESSKVVESESTVSRDLDSSDSKSSNSNSDAKTITKKKRKRKRKTNRSSRYFSYDKGDSDFDSSPKIGVKSANSQE